VSQYDNTNSGALFRNERKQTDKHPDYTGNINVNGVDFWLSAWIKKSKAGQPFMSLSVKPKEEKPQEKPAGVAAPEFDDDLPF
jgi:uncharacterized protein (DUF736 family)